jgi:hypothetical protein
MSGGVIGGVHPSRSSKASRVKSIALFSWGEPIEIANMYISNFDCCLFMCSCLTSMFILLYLFR